MLGTDYASFVANVSSKALKETQVDIVEQYKVRSEFWEASMKSTLRLQS